MIIIGKTLKILCVVVITIVFIVLSILWWSWSPDLARSYVAEKYAYVDSQFYSLASGDRLHYRDTGNKSGPTLLLIHGTSASLHTWEPLARRLGGDFRLVSLDLPGHGLTGPFSQRDYSRKVMIDTIFSLLDELDIASATFVGNSLGGSIAWRAAKQNSTRVNSVVLLSPSGTQRSRPSRSNIGLRIVATELGQSLMTKFTPRAIIEKSLRQTVEDDSIITDDMINRYWELLKMKGNRQEMIDLVRSDRNSEAFTLLKHLSTPFLIIWGQNDQLLPVDMIRQFEKQLIDTDSHVLPNIGHLPQEEAVDIVAELILRFCSSKGC